MAHLYRRGPSILKLTRVERQKKQTGFRNPAVRGVNLRSHWLAKLRRNPWVVELWISSLPQSGIPTNKYPFDAGMTQTTQSKAARSQGNDPGMWDGLRGVASGDSGEFLPPQVLSPSFRSAVGGERGSLQIVGLRSLGARALSTTSDSSSSVRCTHSECLGRASPSACENVQGAQSEFGYGPKPKRGVAPKRAMQLRRDLQL